MATNFTAGVTIYFFCKLFVLLIVINNDLGVNRLEDPETAGRSLEEIDEIFTASKSIFDPVRIAKKLPKQHLSTFLQQEAKNDSRIKDAVQKIEHIDNTSSDPEAATEKSINEKSINEKSDDVV